MGLTRPVLAALLAIATCVQGHTIVRSIWVNGVDQGTGVGVRTPANNGPIGPGYNSSPVKNLTSIDLRCNLLGDTPAPDTITVAPGDVVSFEWGHSSRLYTDDILATSHHGPGVVYISPDPPTDDSWVKLWEEGEYAPGKWFATTKLIEDRGIHSIKIPTDLAPGHYLLRPELITLHEAESIFLENPVRGVQIYMACVQIEVTGTGSVTLPPGVGFPGAYDYEDPGIHYNVYWTEPGAAPYLVPGPTLWSAAEPSIANPTLGTKKGLLTNTPWSKWIITTDSMVYEIKTVDGTKTTVSSSYTATWPTTYVTPTPTA